MLASSKRPCISLDESESRLSLLEEIRASQSAMQPQKCWWEKGGNWPSTKTLLRQKVRWPGPKTGELMAGQCNGTFSLQCGGVWYTQYAGNLASADSRAVPEHLKIEYLGPGHSRVEAAPLVFFVPAYFLLRQGALCKPVRGGTGRRQERGAAHSHLKSVWLLRASQPITHTLLHRLQGVEKTVKGFATKLSLSRQKQESGGFPELL